MIIFYTFAENHGQNHETHKRRYNCSNYYTFRPVPNRGNGTEYKIVPIRICHSAKLGNETHTKYENNYI